MLSLRSLFVVLPLTVGLVLGGCAADSHDGSSESDVTAPSASAPITVANYVSHPKIVAVRKDVAAIDALSLKKDTNPGCDGSTFKWTDAAGKIRKAGESGGEGGGGGDTFAYYGANGKIRFILFSGWTEEEKTKTKSESRVYFDENGKVFWQVTRSAETKDGSEPDLSKAKDALPTDDNKYVQNDGHDATYENPTEWFKITGCPKNP